MKLKIQKDALLGGLKIAQGVADKKNVMPLLGCVLLRITGNKLLLAATDLMVSATVTADCDGQADGGVAIEAKSLYGLASSMPGAEISISRAAGNWTEVKSGRVVSKLAGLPDRDFPKIPDATKSGFSEVDASVLRDMIEKTLISASSDESRFHLNGVLFECNGERAVMASTDGHRLSKATATLSGGPQLPAAGVIIPRKGAAEIKRVLDVTGTAELAISPPYCFVRVGDITLAVKLIEAQFPPYDKVIPAESAGRVLVDRASLIEALKRASLMSSETRGVKFSLSQGVLRIAGDNPDIGEVREELEAEYDGEDISVGFNPKYVLDLIGQMDAQRVEIAVGGETDPCVIRGAGDEGYLGVVMPMKV